LARDDLPVRCDRRGTFVSPAGRNATPLERFRLYCQFDPATGCVLWIGGTTQGRGHSVPYGSFKDAGRRWFAHRWAAVNIHGLEIEGLQVDHCCDPWRAGGTEPLLPNTLCVQHVQALEGTRNRSLQDERRLWVLTQKGYYAPPPLFAELEPPPEYLPPPGFAPIHEPPAWLGLKRVDSPVKSDDDCPF
jgi:hypothetical protein